MRRRAVLLLAMLAVGLPAVLWGAFYWPRLWLFDLYQRIEPSHRDPSHITIIDIDDESVRRIGRWPWPRDQLAQLVTRARAARVIGADILLLDPDRSPGSDPDALLAKAMAQARVVLPATRGEETAAGTISVTPILQSGSDPLAFVPAVPNPSWPLPIIARAASGLGLALVIPERDGVVRRLPTLYAAGATLLPSFALQVLRVAEGATVLRVRSGAAGVEQVSVGDLAMATDANGAIWPHFSRQVPARMIPAYRVIEGDADADLLDGRIVLIGSSLDGLGDVHVTPLQGTETGTAINAQLIASVLARDTLWRPAVAQTGEVLLLAILALVSLSLFGRLTWPRQTALVGGVLIVSAGVSFAAFASTGMLLDWTLPGAGMVALNAGLAALRVRNDRRASRQAEAQLAAALAEVEQARAVVDQALNSTKLATLGEMATVLAHELRQPIATMSMAAENAEAALQEGQLDVGDARVRIDRIIAQAKRAESMIEHLGVFARADPGNPVPVDLEAAVRDSLQLIEPSLRRHGINLQLHIEPGLPRVRAVKVLIEQIVINLCANARDALAETDPGARTITLSLRSVGEAVQLEVADTGPGLPSGTMERLFEPFFTTKLAGAGTGLGLSVCRRIAESFGGTITARNAPDGGAVFVVTLPAESTM